MEWKVVHMFRKPALDESAVGAFMRKLARNGQLPKIENVRTEYCFNIEMENRELTEKESVALNWLLSETFEQDQFGQSSFLGGKDDMGATEFLVEVAPRLTFTTAWSSNAVTICQACGLECIRRIERSRRYVFETKSALSAEDKAKLEAEVHDRMTEFIVDTPIKSFEPDQAALAAAAVGTQWVPIMKEGKAALKAISDRLGLAFDDWDLDFYTRLFKDKLQRDPSDVECFDLAQSNSEHSRHWFFGGKMVIDGKEKPKTLFQLVKGTNGACNKENPVPGNSIIAFHDNSSAIAGFDVEVCVPSTESQPLEQEANPAGYELKKIKYHGILTCETHNFPCGIAPFPGAETGTGGRIRDVQATGRGAHVVAGTSSYCVGNLQIPGYELPWEDKTFEYPSNMASPLQIQIEASNGASDYGNKFGEPVISGYSRSFGMRLPNGERREWVKPIMMSAGVGQLDARHSTKGEPEKGMIVVKLGGPAYRIGMGGGAASSRVQDSKTSDLDFNAVQRGDAEMENKMNRVIRACVELGAKNPIVSIHDQGAGGNGNVLKEIAEPAGAELHLRRVPIGDETMTALELWGAEYQENNALLIRPEHQELFRQICTRENLPFGFVGTITGDGVVKVHDEKDGSIPVDLALSDVLGKMPQKTFTSDHQDNKLVPFKVETENATDALDRVMRLLQVGSKRFLTTKVDRSVTGLVAQQPCVGPLQTPLADVGVIAQSHFPSPETNKYTGVATAIGEQPIKGLVCPKAMARATVAEALTNLVFAKITALEDVKCSGNWMWAAKLPGEGAAMYDACEAMCDVMHEIGIAVDGGKDSLSMAATAGKEVVKCPGQLAISVYAMCTDVTLTVTPDFRPIDGSKIFHVSTTDKRRLGGSAVAQVYSQIGNECPDLDEPESLVKMFKATQVLIGERAIAAGHDISDGGIITAALEMAFAGNVGADIKMNDVGASLLESLFAEEIGLIIQAKDDTADRIAQVYKEHGVSCVEIGTVRADKMLSVSVDGKGIVLENEPMTKWRDVWEATSFELDKLQANPDCVEQEQKGLADRISPPYKLTYEPVLDSSIEKTGDKPKIAVLRQEGSNGDREMASAFVAAGFDAWDVTVADLQAGRIKLSNFQGIVFVGGFSFADVLDSAKGWAGVIRFHETVWNEFQAFYDRPDTFSLGVCNGCQLMALLGWVPGTDVTYNKETHSVEWSRQPRFIHNQSGRYESRFASVKVADTHNAMMLKGMEGSVLGVWISHGEGRAHFPNESDMSSAFKNGQVPLQFVDDAGETTEAYPFNPNGSPDGITALCSPNGRHLAMMPHPERSNLLWQWPWIPEGWCPESASPWSKMFQNAYTWCKSH